MKEIIILAIFFSTNAIAQKITYLNSHVRFTEITTMDASGKTFVLKKNSNLDDLKSLSIGNYKSDPRPELKKKMAKLAFTIKEADKILKNAGTSHNALNSAAVHGPHFEIEEIKVYPSHPSYKELQAIKKEYLALNWAKTEGVALNPDKLPPDCEKFRHLLKCRFEKWGSVFIEAKK